MSKNDPEAAKKTTKSDAGAFGAFLAGLLLIAIIGAVIFYVVLFWMWGKSV